MMTTFKNGIRLMGFGVLAFVLYASNTPDAHAAEKYRDTGRTEGAVEQICPDGWVVSRAPGGCSPGSFLLKQTGLDDTIDCPDGWVHSSAPGGCSPGFFTLRETFPEDTDGCPDGWVSSSAPGGCSPGSFTIKERRVYYAEYHCAFGPDCDVMVDAILALGGTCVSDGPDTTCDLPPLVED